MEQALGFLTVVAIVVAIGLAMRRVNRLSTGDIPAPPRQPSLDDSPVDGPWNDVGDVGAQPADDGKDLAGLYVIAGELNAHFMASGRPGDLRHHPRFEDGVQLLLHDAYGHEDLLDYYTGDNVILACLALEALSRCQTDADLSDGLIAGLNSTHWYTRHYALRALRRLVPADVPVCGRLLTRLDEHWQQPFLAGMLRDFVRRRVAAGESVTFGTHLAGIDDDGVDQLVLLARQLDTTATKTLLGEIEEWRQSKVDVTFLRNVGTVWDGTSSLHEEPVIEHEALRLSRARVLEDLEQSRARSVLLTGESGVGKTVLTRAVGADLRARGWVVFEAGQTELMSGMQYMGQLEERLTGLVQRISGRRQVLWVIPDFHTLSVAGRHQYGRVSILDALLPLIERSEIKVLAECTASGHERLVTAKPRVRTAMTCMKIGPMDEEASLHLAREWSRRSAATPGAPPLVDETVLREAWNLALQYLGDKEPPGSLLSLLTVTRRRLALVGGRPPSAIKVDDFIQTLAEFTGLPSSILDERQSLDLEHLRTVFTDRVRGQEEAVDCLVERVAMIKAGVTDSGRPQGVFLFAGPTGTGKTEIAKTLTGFLFGRPDRMIRLDMSEFQEPASISRLLGEPDSPEAEALVHRIRKQPFSVLLLDEFEKAHPVVWDLFLQVFDDGRLTDRWGNTADFRHAIIVLTSNLGARIPTGASLGFSGDGLHFSPSTVTKAIERTFRREFLNRLDRVVVFRPLGRETMRDILHRELDDAFRRRGLRRRPWAVEWDDSAIEFLLEQGFTADLGARPLKRAIERYLLTPLATTIVNRRAPSGDQFLFVRRNGCRLSVEFVDPDAPETEPEAPPVEAAAGLSLAGIALDPAGRKPEVALLDDELRHLSDELSDLEATKVELLGRTSEPAFWSSPDRFAVLDQVETLDRIQTALKTTSSLMDRLRALASREQASLPRPPIGRVAQRLFLLRQAVADLRAERPQDAFLRVEGGRETGHAAPATNAFATRLGHMYTQWARRRGMGLVVAEEKLAARRGPYRLVLIVSGFGAWSLLEGEAGLHVLELPEGEGHRRFKRLPVHVSVAPQPEAPLPDDDAGRLQAACAAFEKAGPTPPEIVRRYRHEPSPLVRDSRSGWRTGRIDRVLDGDFDLFAAGKG